MTREGLENELVKLGFKSEGETDGITWLCKDLELGNWVIVYILKENRCSISTFNNEENRIMKKDLTYQETLNKFKNEK